jgi:hypothetical protein
MSSGKDAGLILRRGRGSDGLFARWFQRHRWCGHQTATALPVFVRASRRARLPRVFLADVRCDSRQPAVSEIRYWSSLRWPRKAVGMKDAHGVLPKYSPSQSRRAMRPSDWGFGMTICLAAISSTGKEIIAASDSLMSWGGTVTGETSLKYNRLHRRWAVMIAGDDVLPTEPMIRHLTIDIGRYKVPTVQQVEDGIRRSWKFVKNQQATTQVLSAYDLNLEKFIREGRDTFGDIGFADLRAAVDRASELSCELLVYGFDESDMAVLFVVVHPGEPVNFTRLGFAAIGSGRDSAIASLMWNPSHKAYHDTTTVVYRVAAAKFMAESALGVGRDTTISGLKPDGSAFLLSNAQVKAIRTLWEGEGQPRIPKSSKVIEAFDYRQAMQVPFELSKEEGPTQAELPTIATPPIRPASKRDRKDQPPSRE